MVTKKVTSLEVAKLAGVSQSAVSRVFTPGASVSKKTNEKVRSAALEARLSSKHLGSIINYRKVKNHWSSGFTSR